MKKISLKFIMMIIMVFVCDFMSAGEEFYHLFRSTTSCPTVVRWNIDYNNRVDFYIKEKTDSLNRVVEISFNHNQEIFDIWPMYGTPIIRYVYYEDRILEYYYDKDGYLLSYLKCECPCCRVYFLDDHEKISKCELVYYDGEDRLKNIDISNKEICRTKIEKEEYVIFYLYSYNKMNKVFPTAPGFLFDKELLELVYDNELINEEFSKSLNDNNSGQKSK
ncbi:hypothetical protein EYV94_18480 [Puteibacter caeruleilacunae]|nr:hypothetical protein EYV94_18480 [Puteibacter caeruleilacunae]